MWHLNFSQYAIAQEWHLKTLTDCYRECVTARQFSFFTIVISRKSCTNIQFLLCSTYVPLMFVVSDVWLIHAIAESTWLFKGAKSHFADSELQYVRDDQESSTFADKWGNTFKFAACKLDSSFVDNVLLTIQSTVRLGTLLRIENHRSSSSLTSVIAACKLSCFRSLSLCRFATIGIDRICLTWSEYVAQRIDMKRLIDNSGFRSRSLWVISNGWLKIADNLFRT